MPVWGPFWVDVGSVFISLGSVLDLFWFVLDAFGSVWGPFWSALVRFGSFWVPSGGHID